jgi:DNA polymerase-3 subunit delta
MDEEKIEALLKYFENPSPSTCLVMSGQTPGLWKKHLGEIERIGRVVEYPRLKGKALITWIKSRMGERGKSLSEEAAEYFIEVTGDHLHDLDNVLEKVVLSVGDKKVATLSDVEGIASDVKISTVFDLTDAIGRQNLEKALGILEKAMESKSVSFKKEEEGSKVGDPVPLLLSMMARQYRMIWRVKEFMSQKRGAGEAAKELRMSPWIVKNLIEQGKSFSESSLREGLLKCHQTDLAIKRGRGSKELLMEKLVIDLCRPDSPPSPSGAKARL